MAVASLPTLLAAGAAAPANAAEPPARRRRVRLWLLGLALLVGLMVAVGGATRLTGSGLSITEWRPVTGIVPPLTEAAWDVEFAKYRASSQYRNLNDGMELAAFKTIFWWEWAHRLLGRILGIVFLVPLAWFWWRGTVRARLALGLLGIGALGGLQGTVGWIMVASGLEPGMVAVAPVKLTLHLTLASVILALLVWVSTGLSELASGSGSDRTRVPSILVGLVLAQIALGGLVAGSKAGLTYNTWPLMDGRLVPEPSVLFVVRPWFENFIDNPALVQLQHRLLAYGVVALTLWHALSLRRVAAGTPVATRAAGLAAVAAGQAALGVTTLLLAVPLWAGLSHQLLAMVLLALATGHARLSRMEAAR